MARIIGTEEDVVRVVSNGFEATWKKKILSEMQKIMEPELEQLAESLARQIVLATVQTHFNQKFLTPTVQILFKSQQTQEGEKARRCDI